eukprot:scaffold41918_cov34-Phaeocystis_antarctica.AAC.2
MPLPCPLSTAGPGCRPDPVPNPDHTLTLPPKHGRPGLQTVGCRRLALISLISTLVSLISLTRCKEVQGGPRPSPLLLATYNPPPTTHHPPPTTHYPLPTTHYQGGAKPRWHRRSPRPTQGGTPRQGRGRRCAARHSPSPSP